MISRPPHPCLVRQAHDPESIRQAHDPELAEGPAEGRVEGLSREGERVFLPSITPSLDGVGGP